MPNEISALFDAIQTGDEAAVERLLSRSPELASTVGPGHATTLLWACYTGQSGVAGVIRRHRSADPYEAAALGDLDALRAAPLPEADARSRDGWTPLHLAAFFGRAEAARWLLSQGADVNAIGSNASSNRALHAAVAGRHAEVAGILLDAGADPNARQAGGYTALHAAARHGLEPLVAHLVAHGADPNVADDAGLDAAAHARAGGHDALAEGLARST